MELKADGFKSVLLSATPEEIVQGMAEMNAALPNDYPGKLTVEMVEALAWCVSVVDDEYGSSRGLIGDTARTHYPVAVAAIAALRALLPPRVQAGPGVGG